MFALSKFPRGLNNTLKVDGDINIGLMYQTLLSHDGYCHGPFYPNLAVAPELIKHRTSFMNERSDILPNISLGFIFLDPCAGTNSYTKRALEFFDDINGNLTSKVAGIIGPYSSDQSISLSGLTSAFKLPTLGVYATSVELSNKARFEYFSRLVPNDASATVAMVEMMKFFDWKYIQLLFMEGSFGENAAKSVEKNTKKYGICIAYSKRFSQDYSDNFDEIARNVIKHKNAKIIVIFLVRKSREGLFYSMDKLGSNVQFIFLATDAFSRHVGLEHIQHGSITFTPVTGNDVEFREYFDTLQPTNNTIYWTKKLWEYYGDCKFETTCQKYTFMSNTSAKYILSHNKIADGIDVYAAALHTLIQKECPHASSDKTILKVVNLDLTQFYNSQKKDFLNSY